MRYVNVNAATTTVISSSRSTTFTSNINYAASFTGSNPQVSVGLIGLQPTTATNAAIYFLVNIGAQSLTGFTLQIGLNSNCSLSSMKISYFAKTSTYTYMFVDYQSVTSKILFNTVTNLASGSGNRVDTAIVVFSSQTTIDLTHNYVVLPFITGVNINKVSSSNAQLELLTEVYNTTHYKCSYKTGGSTRVYSVTYYSLTFDQTAVQETQSQYLDTIFKTGANNVESTLTLKASSATTFHAGLNGFNYTNANGLSFEVLTTSPFTLSTASAYLYVNISTWNYRNRTCASPNVNYEPVGNLCYSACPAAYYTNATYKFCTPCMYSCATCSSGTNCLTCSSSNFRTLTSNLCPCNAGYFDNGVAACVLCHYSCTTCTSSTSTSCTTCNASRFRTLSSSSCPCNAGYYDNGASGTCVICHYSCATCSAGTSNACLSCPSSSLRTLSTNSCICNAGYYDSGAVTCSACHYSCTTCTGGTNSTCTSCTAANLRSLSSTSCPCSATYYDNGVALCTACLVSCATCDTGTKCLTCVSSNATAQASGGCLCNAGYYSSSATTCAICHYSCTTCTSNTNTTCATCPTSSFRSLAGSSCPCNTGYFDNGVVTCAACHYSCYTCTSATISGCGSCLSTNFRAISGTTCPCTAGYYDSGVAACATCQYSCATCTGSSSTNCTSCPPSTFRTLSSTSCPCNSGYYDSGSSTCSTCNYTCATCTTSASNCLTCLSTNFRTLNSGACPCNAGYYDANVAKCTICHYSCTTCTSASSSSCLTCPSGAYRTLAHGTCPCDNGYYDTGASTCSACLPTCATCTNGTACITCASHNMSPQLSGGCTCDSNYYLNASNLQCVACDPTCSICNSTNCTTCIAVGMTISGTACTCTSTSSYYDSTSKSCIACGSNCATCTSSTSCTSCTSASLSITGGTCTCVSGSCITCGTACTSCTSATSCTTCVSNGMVVNGGSCSCFASDSYFDSSSNACVQCPLGCATCLNSTNCTSCKSASLQLTAAKNCSCIANSQYFNTSTGGCIACPTGCTMCSSSSFCTACADLHMTVVGGLCTCPSSNYFNTSTSTCKTCPDSCSTCTAASTCTSCVNLQMTLANGVCSCSIGKFFDILILDCQSCLASCLTCSSSSACASCNSTLNRQLNATSGLCSCASGYTLNITSDTCYSTGPPTTCQTGYSLVNGICQEICGDGLLFELECDDGNTNNGDGCDSSCHIEADFVCCNGSQTTPSICSYNKSLILTLKKAIKNSFANSIRFELGVFPALKVLDKFDTSKVVTTNLPTSSMLSGYEDGTLIIEINYTVSIQKNEASIRLAPPNDIVEAYAMRLSSTIFVVQPDNNQPAIYYEPTVYNQAKLVDQVAQYTVLTALAVTLIGVFIGKIVVLEMITAMQVILFLLTLINDLSPYLAPLATWVRMSNGYNTMFFYLNNLMSFNHPEVPNSVYAIEYEAEFLYNVNVVLLAEGGILVVVLLLLLVSLFKSGHRTSCAEKVAGFFARQLALSMVMFGSSCVVFCTAINILYGKDDSNFVTNIIIAGVAYIPIIYVIVYYCAATDMFKDAETLLKKDRMSQLHPVILMVQRMVMTALVTLPTIFSQTTYAIAGLQVSYLIYVIVKRPYQKGYMTVRAVFNELLLLVAMFVPLYYSQLSDKFSLGVVQDYLPWFLSGAAMGLVVLAVIFLGFWCLQRCCTKSTDNQVYPMDSADASERKRSEQDEQSQDRNLEVIELDDSNAQIASQKTENTVLGVNLKKGGIRKYERFSNKLRQKLKI